MFGRGRREGVKAGRLVAELADYPPSTPPHLAFNGAIGSAGPVLSLAQARENLLAWRDALPERLRLLAAILATFEIDMHIAYSAPVSFVTKLHPMLLAELPPLFRPDLARHEAWESSDRRGADIVLSFMADLAMMEADVLMRAKPGCFVGLALDPADRSMFSWRRPCLLGLVDRLFPDQPDVFHLEAEWFGVYATMDHPERLAAPDHVVPDAYGLVIGGSMLQRLDRAIVDPCLAERRRTGWLSDAG